MVEPAPLDRRAAPCSTALSFSSTELLLPAGCSYLSAAPYRPDSAYLPAAATSRCSLPAGFRLPADQLLLPAGSSRAQHGVCCALVLSAPSGPLVHA